jgi:hypothetical protein
MATDNPHTQPPTSLLAALFGDGSLVDVQAAPSDLLSAIDVRLLLSDRGDVNEITACKAPSLSHLHCRMA